mmetsp:Transcript_6989/g.8533  ORF Transcript_6989/g.8533 Transcript_6989/m.8533 type:complete len:162 (-) Transcript_6989:542-1027(-)|eukprot:jgi/Bigna1/61219/fgenesh1_kg.19_\
MELTSDSLHHVITNVSDPAFTGIKTLVHENDSRNHQDYIWVGISFVVIFLVGIGAAFLKYSRCKRRKNTANRYHQNYNTFNNMKKNLGPVDLNTAMEKGAIAPYTMPSPSSMKKVQSCPNFGLKPPTGENGLAHRRYSGSYLNMIRLDPITEDTDAESYEA